MSIAPNDVQLRELNSNQQQQSAFQPSPLRASMSSKPGDEEEEEWGSRSGESTGCCAASTGLFLQTFIATDPFAQPLRPRPTGRGVSENMLCAFLLVGLMVSYAVIQAIKLRDLPPVTVDEVLTVLPVTPQSLPVLLGLPIESYNNTGVLLTYACALSLEGVALWNSLSQFLAFADPKSAGHLAIAEPFNFLQPDAVPYRNFTDQSFMAFPLLHKGLYDAYSIQITAVATRPRNYGDVLLDFGVFVGGDISILTLLDGDTFEWTYNPDYLVSVQATLTVTVDLTIDDPAKQTTQRLSYAVMDRIPLPNFSANNFPPGQFGQKIRLDLSATYQRYTVKPQPWVLPWLSSLGGAFTGLVIVLSVLKAVARPLLHSRVVCWISAKLCCAGAGESCINTEIEGLVKRKFQPVQAMQKV